MNRLGGCAAGRQKISLLMAIEKRFNFTMQHLDVRASNFEYLMTRLGAYCSAGGLDTLISGNTPEAIRKEMDGLMLVHETVPIHMVPQWFHYDRTHDLQMLRISLNF